MPLDIAQPRRFWIAACIALVGVHQPASASASDHDLGDWTQEKCRRYATAWDEAQRRFPNAELSNDFVTRHDAFIAGGCTGQIRVCPQSEDELAMANAMIIAAMNAGTASTFPPFACD